jgi:hypothetical protein
VCQHCAKEFWIFASQERKGVGQFCSKSCKDLARTHPKPDRQPKRVAMKVCETCETVFRVPPVRESTARFCSRICKYGSQTYLQQLGDLQRGQKSKRWTGGKYVGKGGYTVISLKASEGNHYRLEHRNVMLLLLSESVPGHPFLIILDGKPRLHPDVVVHHIDRDRGNNDPSNLLIVTREAHSRIHNQGTKPQAWECWPSDPAKW